MLWNLCLAFSFDVAFTIQSLFHIKSGYFNFFSILTSSLFKFNPYRLKFSQTIKSNAQTQKSISGSHKRLFYVGVEPTTCRAQWVWRYFLYHTDIRENFISGRDWASISRIIWKLLTINLQTLLLLTTYKTLIRSSIKKVRFIHYIILQPSFNQFCLEYFRSNYPLTKHVWFINKRVSSSRFNVWVMVYFVSIQWWSRENINGWSLRNLTARVWLGTDGTMPFDAVWPGTRDDILDLLMSLWAVLRWCKLQAELFTK